MIRVTGFGLGPIQTNCYLAWVNGSESCVVIDPGGDADVLLEQLAARRLTPEAILLTHSHWDHIGAVPAIARQFDAPVYISQIEAPVLADPNEFAPAQFGPYEPHTAEFELHGDEQLTIAGIEMSTMLVPGHSPGSIAYFVDRVLPEGAPEDTPAFPACFIGDLIFAGSVGRTDLPFSDHNALLESAARVLDKAAEDTALLPGHGPVTTAGHERATNPFLEHLRTPTE